MALSPLQSLLGRSIRKANIGPQLEALQLFAFVQDFVRSRMDVQTAGELKLQSFQRGILTLRVSSSAMAAQLRAHEEDLQRHIVAEYSKKHGRQIRLHGVRYRLA